MGIGRSQWFVCARFSLVVPKSSSSPMFTAVRRSCIGSGKSTLLSVILGDHPRSFTEDVTLFDKPRYRQATSTSKLCVLVSTRRACRALEVVLIHSIPQFKRV